MLHLSTIGAVVEALLGNKVISKILDLSKNGKKYFNFNIVAVFACLSS